MIVIAIPVLRRPHHVQPLVDSIEQATPAPHRTLFVCSPDDHEEIAAIESAGAEHICTPVSYQSSDYALKINLAYRASWEPLLFLGADDLRFHEGWFEKAYENLREGIGVVGTNDLGNRRTRREMSTHSLVTRDYVDRFGTIDERHKVLHEGYRHNWVDTEFVHTAMFRGAYVHAHDCFVEHLHPHWGKGELDETYEHGLAGFDRDRRVFQGRQHLWTT